MPRQFTPVEVSNFVGGRVSDASPLTFPDNGALSESNMILDPNGTIKRRLGMDYEDSHSIITSGVTYNPDIQQAHSTYRWDNAGSSPDESLLVVQFGNEVKFFNLNNTIVSSEVILTHSFNSTTQETIYSYAVVDGILIVTTGEKTISSFEYDTAANTISVATNVLQIRDLFGVADTISGDDLYDGNNITIRPSSTTDAHTYNLRNQSWAEPRRASNTETDLDPIIHFQATASKYPSNSDAVTKALYPDANDGDNRTIDRFFADDLKSNKFGSAPAPKGHYIIDALERGDSREEAFAQTLINNGSITMQNISALPADTTAGGPEIVAQYAGRAWYGGFNGALTNGDDRSPRMSSYVLFSRRVENVSDIVRCYQDGDPTSIDEPELIDTDGGFIRIDNAYGIQSLLAIGEALFVIAKNGVWTISGDDRGGFTATSFSVSKITDRGATGVRTVVEVEGSFVYWADDGIYNVSKNQFGDWVSESLTSNKIQDFYTAFDNNSIINAQGHYDSYDKKIRWVYDNITNSSTNTKELVLDRALGAFYTNEIKTAVGTTLPKVTGIFESNPFRIQPSSETVVVGSDVVEANSVVVTVDTLSRDSTTREVQYVSITNIDTVIKYTISLYKDTDWIDWKTFDGTGVDAAAFLLTGYSGGGEFQRQKQVNSMTVYSKKTEDGFTEVGDDFVPTNESSIKVQYQWEWTNLDSSNRWGRTFQAYRHRRHYFPVDVNDTFDDGDSVVVSKNKIRGKGRVISILFSTEAGKDFQLYGWSVIIGINSNV